MFKHFIDQKVESLSIIVFLLVSIKLFIFVYNDGIFHQIDEKSIQDTTHIHQKTDAISFIVSLTNFVKLKELNYIFCIAERKTRSVWKRTSDKRRQQFRPKRK